MILTIMERKRKILKKMNAFKKLPKRKNEKEKSKKKKKKKEAKNDSSFLVEEFIISFSLLFNRFLLFSLIQFNE